MSFIGPPINLLSSTEELQRYLCTGLDHLPEPYSDGNYGSVSWTWGRAGGRCPSLDPEAKIPAWRFIAGRLGNVRVGDRSIRASDYMVRKSLMIDYQASKPDIGPIIPPPPPPRPVMAAPDPVFPEQYTGPLIPVAPEPTTTIPVSTGTAMTTLNQGFSLGGPAPVSSQVPWNTIGPTSGGQILGGVLDPLINQGMNWLSGQLFGGQGPGSNPTGFAGATDPCPEGYELVQGVCKKTGISGWLQQTIPGGQTGYLPATQGGIMPGAVAPEMIQRASMRCPKGMVLGHDNWCYHKSAISNAQRKYPRGRRPLLTGGEMKTLTRARSLEKKVQRAWKAAGSPGQRKAAPRARPHHHHPAQGG